MHNFNAQKFMEQVCGRSRWADMKIGDKVSHPEHGEVTIVSGKYWGEYGLSNFWYWTDSKGKEHHGYGW